MSEERKSKIDTFSEEEVSDVKKEEIKETKAEESQDKIEKQEKKEKKASKKELEVLQEKVAKLEADLAEQNDRYLRVVAEYDNYRKRAQKEKEGIYGDAYVDAVKEILPVLDNLERAVAFADSGNLGEGVTMTLNMFRDIFTKMGVEEIPTENQQFDPNVHNAVMHVEDDALGENTVVETFSKGYKKGDKVIRYAMVKVAN